MRPTIVEGLLADIDGVRHGQVRIENGVIAAVGHRAWQAGSRLRR